MFLLNETFSFVGSQNINFNILCPSSQPIVMLVFSFLAINRLFGRRNYRSSGLFQTRTVLFVIEVRVEVAAHVRNKKLPVIC